MASRNIKNLETLKSIVGISKYHEVVNKLGGETVYISPEVEFYDKQQRNKEIREDYYAGMVVSDLMIKYKLSKSRIHKIVGMR